jgi:Tn3 transposase DDE domain
LRKGVNGLLILWNYLYLSEKVANAGGKGREELLSQIRRSSMACWEHINMLGEYELSDERVNTITSFDIPKILELKMR